MSITEIISYITRSFPGKVGCHLDRHENIGRGQIGLDGVRRILNDPRFDNIPFVLETPEFDYSNEVRTLYSLIKV